MKGFFLLLFKNVFLYKNSEKRKKKFLQYSIASTEKQRNVPHNMLAISVFVLVIFQHYCISECVHVLAL